MKFKDFVQLYGGCTIGGAEYAFLDAASPSDDGSTWDTLAIKANDTPDEDGDLPVYCITWAVLPAFDPNEDGPDLACDWDNPVDVEASDYYFEPETGNHYLY